MLQLTTLGRLSGFLKLTLPSRNVRHRLLNTLAALQQSPDALIAAFPDVMDCAFTAQAEDWLDDVSRGGRARYKESAAHQQT